MKNRILLIFAISLLFIISSASALDATVCCEKTISGLYCQNVPAQECTPMATQAPTACESTSYCKSGTCFNSGQGTCLDNTPEIVCNANGGIWSATEQAQCDLGCCILGDQAAFVSLTRCKYLSSNLGLQTNYNKGIKNEVQCVLQVQAQDRGACVYDYEFQRTCKFTTRDQCNLGSNKTALQGNFFKDKLCSDDELATNCGPSKKTMCVPGKDEVYFVDTCGNPANIYDASMVFDGNLSKAPDKIKDYWKNVKTKSESCAPNSLNANSKTCGNCNYLQGSICRASSKNNLPSYGDSICADLNCKKTSNGQSYKHGESWCVYDDAGTFGKGNNAVGSQFFKHICINGEEVLEACADFRAHECIEDSIDTGTGKFSQAACRVNRWQECIVQTDKLDCENADKRDCLWRDYLETANKTKGACIPKNPPGLTFWQGEETKNICAKGNVQCIVKFEKGLFDDKEEPTENKECMTQDWEKQRIEFCQALGDCGPKVNWLNHNGYKAGFNISIVKQ